VGGKKVSAGLGEKRGNPRGGKKKGSKPISNEKNKGQRDKDGKVTKIGRDKTLTGLEQTHEAKKSGGQEGRQLTNSQGKKENCGRPVFKGRGKKAKISIRGARNK